MTRTQSTLLALLLLLPAGCMQEMAAQPRYRPLQPSDLFDDGRSARPLAAGTVPHGFDAATRSLYLREDRHYYEGLKGASAADAAKLAAAVGTPPNPAAAATIINWLPYADTFPLKVDRAVLERGRQRYDIYCAVCHDRAGTGDGMIARRGFTKPPNFHTDESRGLRLKGIKMLLSDVPVGYYFQVITHGFGAMPKYAVQVPPEDRWAIVAYVRALQFSQHAKLADVPAAERATLEKARAGQ
jgi:mono/diheme cytochrome c family protein